MDEAFLQYLKNTDELRKRKSVDWHRHFTWIPVKLNDGSWAWLKFVMRYRHWVWYDYKQYGLSIVAEDYFIDEYKRIAK